MKRATPLAPEPKAPTAADITRLAHAAQPAPEPKRTWKERPGFYQGAKVKRFSA